MMTIRRALLAALALPIALVACSSNNNGKAAESTPAPAPAPAQTPPPKTTTPSAPPAPKPVANDTPAPPRTGMKFRFGIMPGNYDDDQDGVAVADVYEGTSAAAAGIRQGDRLMTWNGKKIIDVQDWMKHMAPHNAGDVVDVGVLRDGAVIPIKVTLKPAE